MITMEKMSLTIEWTRCWLKGKKLEGLLFKF